MWNHRQQLHLLRESSCYFAASVVIALVVDGSSAEGGSEAYRSVGVSLGVEEHLTTCASCSCSSSWCNSPRLGARW